jgi:hypothetical protein
MDSILIYIAGQFTWVHILYAEHLLATQPSVELKDGSFDCSTELCPNGSDKNLGAIHLSVDGPRESC